MSRTFDAGEIATMAARIVQAIGPVQTLDEQRHRIALSFLDMIVAEIAGIDSRPWLSTGPQTVALEAGRQSYDIGAFVGEPIQFLHQAWRRDARGRDTPLRLVEREDYDLLDDKMAVGLPDWLYVDHGRAQAYLWPIPNVDGHSMVLDGYGFADDLTRDKGSVAHGLPAAWQRHLVYRLAGMIGDGPLIKAPAGDRDRWSTIVADTGDRLMSYNSRRTRTLGFVRPYMP